MQPMLLWVGGFAPGRDVVEAVLDQSGNEAGFSRRPTCENQRLCLAFSAQ